MCIGTGKSELEVFTFLKEPCCLGGRGIPCQSQPHQSVMGVCDLMYVEEGGYRFPQCVLRFPVMQHEQQFKKMWLDSHVSEEAWLVAVI